MVTIGKLGKGQESYYLDSVASGAEDYYAGEGEAPGQWTGAAASELGVSGEVQSHELKAILAGLHPATGEPLPRILRADRLPGFDVTFSAPKSVSVLWAVADRPTVEKIRAAHERAVDAALSYLEREAAFTRLGTDGHRHARGSGFIAAAFRHLMSRAGDPQLHTHVLVANLVKSPDGHWRSLDGQRLYRHAKGAGYLYQAHLRHELAKELGLSFREVRRGAAEIAGVPDATLRAFSRRRAEVQAQLESRGASSAKAAQVAALSTRPAKDRTRDAHELRREWRQRARESGFVIESALSQRHHRDRRLPETRLLAHVEKALTDERSTFSRRQVLEELAAAHEQGAPVEEIERLADRFLGSEQVVALGSVRPVGSKPFAPSELLYSTREVLALEARLVRRAEAHAQRRLAVADPRAVESALARDPLLGDDQRELVRRLAADGAGTTCVLGRAGAGKTRALGPLREAFAASGVEVIGASTQNTAARILEAEAGIRSTSITKLLWAAEAKGYGLPRGGVVVVDEAAMASTSALAALQELAIRANARLILVGDPAQLPAITHPGAFRALCDRLGALELTEVRRLKDPIERAAVELVREGRGSSAIEAYHERGRLTLHDSIADLEANVVADRHRAHRKGADAIILVRTRARARRLNELAQALRGEAGQVGAEAIEVGEVEVRAGDLVVTRANRGGAEPVHNRERWTVEALDAERRKLVLRHLAERDRVVTLERDYLDRQLPDATSPVELGYAITRYGAQGMSVDRAFVVMTDGLTKEDAYVALTRAREATELHAVAREPIARAEFAPEAEERAVVVENMGGAVERTEQGALAINEHVRGELERVPTNELVVELARLESARVDPRRRRAEALRDEVAKTEAALAELRQKLERMAGHDQERPYVQTSCAHAAKRLERLRVQERELSGGVREPSVSVERLAAIERELAGRRRAHLEIAISTEPAYVTEALGRKPQELRPRLEWERAVERLEALRQRLGVKDRDRALGVAPQDLGGRRRWDEVQQELDSLRRQVLERSVVRERSRGMGIER